MIIRRASAFHALLAIAALLGGGGAASSSTVAIQYDEIARVVVGQATPPPPDGFASDLAAITNATSAQNTQRPAKRHGFGNMLGAVLQGQSPFDAAAGGLADDATSNAMAGLAGSLNAFSAFMRQGKVAHYTFYNGWERVDDVATKTATITKFDRHQIIYLDLQKKTYRTSDPSASTEEAKPDVAGVDRSKRVETSTEQPGTAVVDFSRVGASLGPAILDGVATTGFSNRITLSMTRATGSCRNGSFTIAGTQYFSTLPEPQIAPGYERPPSRVPTDPRGMVSRGGCAPKFTAHNSGVTPPAGRFSMYSNVTMQQPQDDSHASSEPASAGSFAFVTERGNVQALSADAAARLFEIPAGFAPAQ